MAGGSVQKNYFGGGGDGLLLKNIEGDVVRHAVAVLSQIQERGEIEFESAAAGNLNHLSEIAVVESLILAEFETM